jgi:opacity protein-like surface antigen
MKAFLITTIALLLSLTSIAQLQENSVTISGGYAFTKSDFVGGKITGWRINGVYEYAPYQNNFSHGIAFGYIATKESVASLIETIDYKYNAFPIYYAPRFSFGADIFKIFVNGAIGMHFSNYKQTGPILKVSGKNAGFYGGLGAGFIFNITDAFYIDLEYNWAYMSNSFYKKGFMNSAMFGIGFRF